MASIRIVWSGGSVLADLQPGPTVDKLLSILPCESSVNTWGKEVYFEVPMSAALEADAQQVVAPGTVCFWVEGNALALPWVRTPISRDDECRLASACNVLGRLRGDAAVLNTVRSGGKIRIEAA